MLAFLTFMASPVRAIETPYTLEQFCDQRGFLPHVKRSISTVGVREIQEALPFYAGTADLGQTPWSVTVFASHDGPKLPPAATIFTYGHSRNFIPELKYPGLGSFYLALTYIQGHQPSAHDSDLSESQERRLARGHRAGHWMFGLRGFIEVACLPSPDLACYFLEDSILGKTGDVYYRNQSFCHESPTQVKPFPLDSDVSNDMQRTVDQSADLLEDARENRR